MKTKFAAYFLLLIFLVTYNTLVCYADPIEIIIDTDVKYDIYFSVADRESSVVRNVTIYRIVNIDGNKFLEIGNVEKLKMKSNKGFLKMNKISAILPSGLMNPKIKLKK